MAMKAWKWLIPAAQFGLFSSGISANSLPTFALEDCNASHFQSTLRAAEAKYEASAYWLDEKTIQWPGVKAEARFALIVSPADALPAAPQPKVGERVPKGAQEIMLSVANPVVSARFQWLERGVQLTSAALTETTVKTLLKSDVALAQLDAQNNITRLARLQHPGALDRLYAAADNMNDLGVSFTENTTQIKLWAPTARSVAVCMYPDANAPANTLLPMQENATTGVWELASNAANLRRRYYEYMVDVFVPGVGVVRNRVTDPYSISLSADSQRSYIAALDDPDLKPNQWAQSQSGKNIRRNVDMTIYELHVRDFSMTDASVRAPWRGKYLAFTEGESAGVKHLRALAKAGLTDVHLLPVFDIASIPEKGCNAGQLSIEGRSSEPTPIPHLTSPLKGEGLSSAAANDAGRAGETAQRIALANADSDCYNWGYDPQHYTAPEGSYATDANDGAARVMEFRKMVQALHALRLRVGMDVVYNHTSHSGQHAKSVLDRIVPGYYHRLNSKGEMERSTCCENTATEHMMMGKLMIDSVVTWATHYKIDSFRFDLMGHQPRSVMEALQKKVDAAVGKPVQLIGEGWNFGEIENNKRFAQASQLSLNGSGIATFSDRGRDALRGGGYGDNGETMVSRTGWLHGNTDGQRADWARVGLAGSLRSFPMQSHKGEATTLEKIDYNGNAAGYVTDPNEVVNYVENHDNHTLFDLNAFRLPLDTSAEDRARVQVLGLAHTAFSQGVAYFHAGVELMRSKSFDQNSYDSGDWFNRIDWTGQTNYFATGLPPLKDNAGNLPQMRERLLNKNIPPAPQHIDFVRKSFHDLLSIRASSRLFRLETAPQVLQRLRLLNVGPKAINTLLAGHLAGRGLPEAGFAEVLYFINADEKNAQLSLPSEIGKRYQLHPIHERMDAADPRPRRDAKFDTMLGAFLIPPRSAVVFVVPAAQ
jgi:pullulanase